MMSAAPRAWDTAELNAEIRGSIPLVVDVLAHFERSGVVIKNAMGRYECAPNNPYLHQLIVRLARLNAEYPMAIIKEIVRAPNDKIRTFVAAFEIKGD